MSVTVLWDSVNNHAVPVSCVSMHKHNCSAHGWHSGCTGQLYCCLFGIFVASVWPKWKPKISPADRQPIIFTNDVDYQHGLLEHSILCTRNNKRTGFIIRLPYCLNIIFCLLWPPYVMGALYFCPVVSSFFPRLISVVKV